MSFIHRLTARIHQRIAVVRARIVQLRARMVQLRQTLPAAAGSGIRRLGPWLRRVLDRTEGLLRTGWPALKTFVVEKFSPSELKRRIGHLRQWIKEHDTVPPGETARRRDRLIERLHSREQRAVEREQRLEEQARKREKKELEDRQTYSVYFE